MRTRGLSPRRSAALLVALAALALGRPAYAQKPVILYGQNPVIIKAQSTLNGTPVDTSSLVQDIIGFNSPGYLVLFPNGVFGFIASNATFPGLQSGFPVYGTVQTLPNGYVQLNGNNNRFQNGNDAGTTFVGGTLFVYQGRFYAVLTYIGTSTYPVINGSTPGTDVVVDVVTYLLPLQVAG